MCFSAAASFTAAAGLAAAGVACQVGARDPRERLLAAFPSLFAVQQAVEGVIWLRLADAPGAGEGALPGLSAIYLAFAYVVWPAITPAAAWLIEPNGLRRKAMLAAAGLGAGVAFYLLWTLATGTYLAEARDGHIAYFADADPPLAVELAYAVAVIGPLAISSHRAVQVFGAVVAAGAAVSYFGLPWGRASVWCFFAAAASAVLVFHFFRRR
ncbi:hypothetical protein DDZ18_10830 [Marinicauda salina]|uniref:Uncharacterized protein n=1 Tax=Marinicauda salina TaxID=2135793 RepID=A0A2U2BRS5_9PROT|nr:DUF6629 family protein [Marinicauda salina]PWE16696.1 hypothetical protein DDZ18_10830 [Marinicauda salina]